MKWDERRERKRKGEREILFLRDGATKLMAEHKTQKEGEDMGYAQPKTERTRREAAAEEGEDQETRLNTKSYPATRALTKT